MALYHPLFAVLAAVSALGHVALWDGSMYSYDINFNDAKRTEEEVTLGRVEGPLAWSDNHPIEKWFCHGFLGHPPKEGAYMELPSGGTYHGSLGSGRGMVPKFHRDTDPDTRFTKPFDNGMACSPSTQGIEAGGGFCHAKDPWGTPLSKVTDVRGSAIAIAYESDASKVKPEDFAVISVNYSSPWLVDTDFQIPNGLPACPPGGCTCAWGWIHSANFGYSREMYHVCYRCKIVNPDPNGRPLPKPVVSRKCPFEKTNCTLGAKQMHYWSMRDYNNNYEDPSQPPSYNGDYGFMNGAQTDLWEVDKGTTWSNQLAEDPKNYEEYVGSWRKDRVASAVAAGKASRTELFLDADGFHNPTSWPSPTPGPSKKRFSPEDN